MKEFLANRAQLMAEMAKWRAQHANGVLDAASFADFRSQHADLLLRQQQLMQILSQQQGKNPLATPQPLRMFPNASPQLQSYLTARDQLVRDQIT